MYTLYKLLILCVVVLNTIDRITAEDAVLNGRCWQNGLPGICRPRAECASVSQIPIEFRMISPCEDAGAEMVCCLDVRVTPVTELPTVEHVTQPSLESECAPIQKNLTTEKTGRKAWDKCIEYQQQLVYPCKRSPAIMRQYSRRNYCRHSVDPVIIGGRVSTADEFPHMVQLGFKINDYVIWHCSGTLLSDWFILTAGHCTSTPTVVENTIKLFPVSHAAIGFLQSQSDRRPEQVSDGYQVYSIPQEGIIKHPDYRPPKKYHDIALIKTAKRIFLSPSAVPACLDIFGGDTVNVTATGWGQTEPKSYYAYIMQKVTLNRFSDEECYKETRRIRHGPANTTIQMCYGHYTKHADTCKGDSGGPLTIHNPKVNCMYSVVGVTSYGRTSSCGVPGIPGVYTKVSYYVPWIESIVWADSNDTSTSEHL